VHKLGFVPYASLHFQIKFIVGLAGDNQPNKNAV